MIDWDLDQEVLHALSFKIQPPTFNIFLIARDLIQEVQPALITHYPLPICLNHWFKWLWWLHWLINFNDCLSDGCLASEYDNVWYDKSKVIKIDAGIIHFYLGFTDIKEAGKVSDHVPVVFEFEVKEDE